MKRKVLAVALSLALLSSLFVFASPVTGKPDGAAAQAEKFEVTFTFSRVGSATSTTAWYGNPATLTLPEGAEGGPLDPRTAPGTVQIHAPHSHSGNISGDFGPVIGVQSGTYTTDAHIVNNYQTGTRIGTRMVWADFGGGNTATFKINSKGQYLYWRYTDPTPSQITSVRASTHGSIRLIDGTGIFEDLKFVGEGYREITANIFHYEGIGHMAPK